MVKFKKDKTLGLCIFTNRGAVGLDNKSHARLMGNPKDGIAIFKDRTAVTSVVTSIKKMNPKVIWTMTGKAFTVKKCD